LLYPQLMEYIFVIRW